MQVSEPLNLTCTDSAESLTPGYWIGPAALNASDQRVRLAAVGGMKNRKSKRRHQKKKPGGVKSSSTEEQRRGANQNQLQDEGGADRLLPPLPRWVRGPCPCADNHNNRPPATTASSTISLLGDSTMAQVYSCFVAERKDEEAHGAKPVTTIKDFNNAHCAARGAGSMPRSLQVGVHVRTHIPDTACWLLLTFL